jgi:hypothetical protein
MKKPGRCKFRNLLPTRLYFLVSQKAQSHYQIDDDHDTEMVTYLESPRAFQNAFPPVKSLGLNCREMGPNPGWTKSRCGHRT